MEYDTLFEMPSRFAFEISYFENTEESALTIIDIRTSVSTFSVQLIHSVDN